MRRDSSRTVVATADRASSPGRVETRAEEIVRQASEYAGAYSSLAVVAADGAALELVTRFCPDEVAGGRVASTADLQRLPMAHDASIVRAVRSGRAVLVEDAGPGHRATEPPEVAALLEALDARTLVALPLWSRGAPVGALVVVRGGPGARPFDSHEVAHLRALADGASATVADARLVRLEQRRSARLRTLMDAARRFAQSTSDLDELIDEIVQTCSDATGIYCSVGLVSEDASCYHVLRRRGRREVEEALGDLRELGAELLQGQTVVALAVASGQPQIARSADRDEYLATLPPPVARALRAARATTLLSLPLVVRGTVIGAMCFVQTARDKDVLDDEAVDFLRSLADHAALALANARLLAQAQRAEGELRVSRDRLSKALVATGHFVEAIAEPDALLAAVVRKASELLEAQAGLLLVSEDGASLDIAAQWGPDPDVLAEKVRLAGTSFPLTARAIPAVQVVLDNAPVLLSDIRGSGARAVLDPLLRPLVDDLGVNDFAGVPVRIRGRVVGALCVQQEASSRARRLTPSDVELLQMLADQAALAMTNAKLLGDVKRELEEHTRTREALGRSEESFRRAQRMEAVGRLAGGIAHDFNNVLSVVLSYGEMMHETLKDGDPLRDDVQEIVRAARRAADLTRQLLAFSRKQVLAPRVVDLNATLEGMQRMIGRLVGEDIEVHVAPEPALARCLVDPGQIEQVVLNLVVNARDAMPEGGHLTLETKNVVLDESYVATHPEASAGPHVMIAVTDSGIGMDKATIARIFEPFFTTKPKGVGTGLGLATVYGIVKQSGGSIWVYSEPNVGTTFKIYLPTSATQESDPTASSEVHLVRGGTETVLVVEDEPQVRNLVRAILAREGYRVLLAQNGGEALLLCEEHGAEIHMLLTDVVMPLMGGRQLAERLRRIRPDMRVLYMSGYTEASVFHHGVLAPEVDYLPKPITPLSLLAKVRAVLDRAAS